ncbi:hypothetical protein CFOL_v3_05147, partial [Cephalotus follicularis]
EELDETKAELEKLRADYRSKVELFERLKRAHNEQLTIIQEASTKLEKQAQELNEKEEEISIVKQMYEDVKSSWNEKESIIKSLTAINDKLRFGSEEKFQKLEERERKLIYALDEANEKNIDQEQKINVFKAEIEGLKGMLSLSQNKCLEAEKRAKASKELRARDDVLLKLEEENRKIEERLKWKEEQFKHLEDAHEKLRDQFKVTKKEWELEKSTLVDEIYSLQTSLESQTRISEDLQNRLKLCNQALAHEESRRKYLEVEVSEYKTRFDNVFIECQDTKAQLVSLSAQRDKEIAALRHSLGTKETYYKEMEYRAGRLEQENEELLASLKELQEAQIYQTGSSSSLAKLRNKLKSVEQMYRDFSANFRAKEAEWSSQLEKMTEDLNDCRSELEIKIASIEELKIELEGCHSLIMQLRMQNEESSVMLLVLQSVISETQLKLTDVEAEMGFHNKEREERVSRLMKHLETMNAALATAQKDIDEEREKSASLLRRVESLYDIEDQQLLMQKELQRYKEMLEESSNCQLRIKEQALQTECDLKDKLRGVCDALDTANSELVKEREKAASLSIKVESLEVIEGQLLLMQKELERCKEMLDESSRYQLHLEGQVLQIESDSKEKLREVCNALDTSNSELTEEREKVASLSRRVESLDRIKEQKLLMQTELERFKKMFEEESRCQLCLEESTLRMKRESESKLKEVCDALDTANSELAEKICEGHAIEFELWIWKSIAEQLKAKLEENHKLRKALESSLLAQTEVGETIKQEKYVLVHELEEKDRRLSDAHQQIVSLEQEVKTRELEAASSARIETVMSFESEKESFHHITREKSMTLENLQKQIGWLEQESLGREIEGAVFAQIWAERASEHEKENLVQLIEQKDQRIDDLLQLVSSMEEKSNSSLHSVSSQLVEKQTEVNLVREVWEKVAAAQILAELEIEEKKLMIVELEDDIYKKQQKLELQEKSLSRGKQQALDIETELEAKQLEMEMLINQMEAKLRISDALVDELKSEKRNLVGDVMKLSSERENLLAFIGGQDDKINELSKEDMQLMGTLGRIVQSFDDSRSDVVLKGSGELFECVKENIDAHPSPTSKSLGAIFEERSPFRQLN